MGSAIARILVGSVPSEPRLPAAPSAPVYEIGDDGGSFGSAAAPSVGLCGVTPAAFLLLGAPPAGLRERRRLGGGALERYTARHRSVIRRASSLGELRCCLVRERCIALPGRGLTLCHGNVAWVNRLERPETVRLPLAFAFWSTSWAPCHSPCPSSHAAHRRCVRTRGPHHLSPHPRDGGDPRFSPDA